MKKLTPTYKDKNIQIRKLGRNYLEVSALELGCIGLIFSYAQSPSKGQSIKLIRQGVELGVNFFDTVEIYGPLTIEDIGF